MVVSKILKLTKERERERKLAFVFMTIKNALERAGGVKGGIWYMDGKMMFIQKTRVFSV